LSSVSARSRLFRYWKLIVALVTAREVHEFALRILAILSKLGLALPAAYLVHRTIRPMSKASGRHRVLIIEKWIFNDDALEVLGGGADCQVYGVKRAILKCMALGILPRALCDDSTYLSDDPVAERAKIRYLRFWRRVWRYLLLFRRYDAVLSGNWCYWAEREMASALEDHGTPFVVLHKEGIKPPERSRMLRDLFRRTRGRFTGRRVLVYHELERDHQIGGNIARADQIKIVGMPRLDRLHAWRRLAAAGKVPARSSRPMALVLGFLPNNFLPSYSGVESGLAWDELCSGTYRAALRLALEHPWLDVIVRPRLQEMEEVEALLAKEGARPANLRVSAEGDITPFIQDSWVICGHNTTVLLEGLAAGKPVVMPDFGEAQDVSYHGYIVELGAAVEHANSVDDLVARMLQHCRSPDPVQDALPPAAIVELERWTGNADGRASERARNALLEEFGASASR